MAIVIRYRCRRCGAAWEGGSGSAWVRCRSCGALVGFDWLSFFESDGYRRHLADSVRDAASRAARYQALQEAAKRAPSLAAFRAVAESLVEMAPFAYPPEAAQAGPYRERHLAFLAWWMWQSTVDVELASLSAKLDATARAFDMKDPMPTLRGVVDILKQQHRRLERGDAPPDPDDLLPHERAQISVGMMCGAYLSWLSPEQRLALLRELHGATEVRVQGDGASDDVGYLLEWTCDLCGLLSLQPRTAPELTCLGCMFRRPFRASDAQLGALEAPCASCGAKVHVGAGQLHARCLYCGTELTRLGRTGQVERDFALSVMRQHGAAAPEGGTPGMPVTPENRASLVLSGLARMTLGYSALIDGARFGSIARRNLSRLGVSEAAGLTQIEREVATLGNMPAAMKLVADARTWMRAHHA